MRWKSNWKAEGKKVKFSDKLVDLSWIKLLYMSPNLYFALLKKIKHINLIESNQKVTICFAYIDMICTWYIPGRRANLNSSISPLIQQTVIYRDPVTIFDVLHHVTFLPLCCLFHFRLSCWTCVDNSYSGGTGWTHSTLNTSIYISKCLRHMGGFTFTLAVVSVKKIWHLWLIQNISSKSKFTYIGKV